MVEGADTKEKLVILRNESYTIAILHHRTKALEDFMMGNWNLWEEREVRNEREGGEERERTGMKEGRGKRKVN